ncbi:MAG: hypothetical protein Q8O42_00045 [Acidobacteriota bacterium]|nr:hypothetical protein [Acidobacteriota bacterium]
MTPYVLMTLMLMFSTPDGRDPEASRNLRPIDATAARLITEGVGRSSTLAALVDRIERSDVIAYVETESCRSKPWAGRLRFVTAAGGRRFLRIGVCAELRRTIQIAMLAHELQHAVEIAGSDAYEVEAVRALYERIGVPRESSDGIACFDTAAAVSVGRAALKDVLTTRATRILGY